MRSVLLASLLVLTALAGCSGSGDQGGTPVGDDDKCELEPALCDPDSYLATHHCIANDIRPRIYAPDTPGPDLAADPWVQGDYWTYAVRADDRSFTSTLVYYDDADFANNMPQHYLVGSQSAEEALDHALYSINPMLGRIHRSLYSPHEAGLHSDMFHFPLCDGSTWTTVFYDTTFDLKATPQPVPPGAATDAPGFVITGTSQDGSSLRLVYSPSARWFTSLALQRADGLVLTMDMTDNGSGKTGEYYFLRAQQDETVDLANVAPGTPANVDREDGGEGPYDTIGVNIDAARRTGQGRIEVHLRDPDGMSRACVQVAGSGLGSSTCPVGPLKTQVPYAPGTWTLTVERPVGDLTTTAMGTVSLASIYDRSGTV